MRGWTRRWILPEHNDAEQAGTEGPTPGMHAHTPLVERILRSRGLHDAAAQSDFCDPRLKQMHDPSLLPGADAAAERIIHAARTGETIVIYGDYDVDGITATAILYHIIKACAADVDVGTYVPHRLEEGYGLNAEALQQIAAGGATLVVTVDCGVTAHREAALARTLGLDLIITDHHHLPEDVSLLPDAHAIVHPRHPTGRYPFGDLCGAGVAFKLAWRIATMWCGSERVSEVLQHRLLAMLPLAALGTIADVVPLVDENRVITTFGLRYIKQTPLPGLRALIEASALMDERIDCEKVGFVLGPRLNACGRMGHAREAVHLFTDATPEQARTIAQQLTRHNQLRQDEERRIFQRACELAEDAGMTRDDHRIIVLAEESWHPGVVGIVCSRLVERFGRPAVLLQRNGELCKGSARSIDGFSIHRALASCANLLTTFGGHDAAAGLSLHPDRLATLTETLREYANANITVEQLVPTLRVDCDADVRELDPHSVGSVAGLAPFGRCNPRPAVRLSGVTLAEAPRQLGAQGKHLELRFRQNGDGRWLRGVWWREGARAAELAAGMTIDAVIEPKLSHWNGRTVVEAVVCDVRPVA